MGKFFAEQTQCLYLDQFAVSRICIPSPPDEWADISVLIKQAADKGVLICPNSIEQIIETTGMEKEAAKSLEIEFQRLSSGWCFFTEVDISAHYFICKIRKSEMSKQHFIRSNTQNYAVKSNVYEELGRHNLTFRKMVEEATSPVNVIRAAARGGARRKKTLRDSLVELIKDKYSQEMKTRMYLFGTQGQLTPKTIILAGQAIPFWADTLCSTLINKHHMTQQEALSAYDVLQNEGIDAIPSLSIRASLEAMAAHKGAKETPNDQIDVMRIAGALPFADMMLIDGAKVSDVRELGLDKKFRTTVYSGQAKDLTSLRKRLDTLINAHQ